jgi:integrase
VKGKLIWKSLKTDRKTVADLRLSDLERQERAKSERGQIIAKGTVLFQHALNAYREKGFRPATPRTAKDAKPLKPAAIAYYEQRVLALLNSWPGLVKAELRKITERDCHDWAEKAGRAMSASVFNHTIGLLRNIIDFGIKIGARYDNPASTLVRKSEVATRLTLPSSDEFERFVSLIETSGSGWAKPCAELVRFMAYGGLRKGEAAHVAWADRDFDRKLITVRGPATGLKNRRPGETRLVPMIPEMLKLLTAMRATRQGEPATSGVMRVNECQKATDRAAKEVGMSRITHHDLRHLFATRCIESGVDIPTVSRWLGHKDGGALAMKVYGHLRDQHSAVMAQRVEFRTQRPIERPTV